MYYYYLGIIFHACYTISYIKDTVHVCVNNIFTFLAFKVGGSFQVIGASTGKVVSRFTPTPPPPMVVIPGGGTPISPKYRDKNSPQILDEY